jgi:excinuclease ABC subunit C
MRDRRGRIIYVGKAISLRKRVQSYFRDASLRSGSPKLRSLVNSIDDLEFLVVRNEAEAVLTEGRLIKEYKPRYNVSFRDDKRFLLIRVDPREPFPRLTLARLRREDGACYFGPYASSASARAAVDFLEKRLGLRPCAPRVPDETTYRHCLDHIIRQCSAPCMARVSEAEYAERVSEACAFLQGERPVRLKDLEADMNAAARAMDFERAAVLRDALFRLRGVVQQKVRLALTPERRRGQARQGVEDLQSALGLPGVPWVIEAFDISHISGTYSVASMVSAVEGVPQRSRYRRFRIRTVSQVDDPQMMAEVVRRRYTRLVEEQAGLPDLVLVDGGITQVRAARRVLDDLGLARLPAAGLAKRFEEVYRPERAEPILLAMDSPGLKVLQQLRDEAHRFALAYHQRLRSRRIRESVLDEVPGIGRTRKEQLLTRFGSVKRILAADETELADAAPGLGVVMAKNLKDALRVRVGGGEENRT